MLEINISSICSPFSHILSQNTREKTLKKVRGWVKMHSHLQNWNAYHLLNAPNTEKDLIPNHSEQTPFSPTRNIEKNYDMPKHRRHEREWHHNTGMEWDCRAQIQNNTTTQAWNGTVEHRYRITPQHRHGMGLQSTDTE